MQPNQTTDQAPQAPETKTHPVTWIALAGAVLAVVLVLAGENSAMISAGTPLTMAVGLGICAVVAAVVGANQGAKAWAIIAIIVGGVAIWIGWYDLHQVHQCLADLLTCGQAHSAVRPIPELITSIKHGAPPHRIPEGPIVLHWGGAPIHRIP